MPETGAGAVEPTPDVDELYQQVPEAVAVPVKGEGAFLVNVLPSRYVQAATDVVPIGVWTSILPATPKRCRTVLLSTDKPFYYSPSGTGSTGMLWPANVSLELRNTKRIYVMSADAAVAATISHVSELWAD